MADKKPENPFAFPLPLGTMDSPEPAFGGMTLRDYFAAAALQGLCALPGQEDDDIDYIQELPKSAYKYADEMLKARKS